MKGVSSSGRGKERRRRMGPLTISFLLSLIFLIVVAASAVDAQSEEDDSEHDYHNNEWTFLIISFVMTYGAAAIIAGLFAIKYAQRRSKYIGGAMMISGLIPWGIWITFNFILKASYPDDTIFNIIYWSTAPIIKPLLAVLGMILGGGLALFIFLTVVVRS
jgi:hypothetical protein